MVTGLTRLTSRVHADEELVHGALLVLIKEGDFSVSNDVAIARGVNRCGDRSWTQSVRALSDWDRYDRAHLSVSLLRPTDEG
jgi:hypothetical protein